MLSVLFYHIFSAFAISIRKIVEIKREKAKLDPRPSPENYLKQEYCASLVFYIERVNVADILYR